MDKLIGWFADDDCLFALDAVATDDPSHQQRQQQHIWQLQTVTLIYLLVFRAVVPQSRVSDVNVDHLFFSFSLSTVPSHYRFRLAATGCAVATGENRGHDDDDDDVVMCVSYLILMMFIVLFEMPIQECTI
jgi:hypothetical protein